SKSEYFPNDGINMMRSKLEKCTDVQISAVCNANYKNPTTMLIVSVLVGVLGVDRFMFGETGMGILKLITCGGLWIWWIIDMIMIMNMTKRNNLMIFENAVAK
ncbi:MAG: TM2 domain-containing protein, partial [Bacteroidales bacterium]|nr:TM2 domain-containing protein [Candidatus Colimorpha onthohippi]